ncbi:MAG TPA: N-methyl-L-tryptophan oxidase [Gemmataceae bacterium]|nr:N-methyl-L-tryptophan oxidase [Gemmataceae bacterium]
MYDVIVLGLGGMGTAAASELARRGRKVLGLEQFSPAHDQGSSHGRTRVIRTAYYEHPAYVPLVRRAFRLWYELEQRVGRHLLTECPCLSIGEPGGELIKGVRRAAAEHRLAVEHLDLSALVRRFPLFRSFDSHVGELEHEAGFLYVERCVKAAAADALVRGATLHWTEPAHEWQASDTGVTVRTDREIYHAARLVITAGAWATRVLGQLGARLTVMRQVPMWFAPPDLRPFARERFPIYLAETVRGTFYGLPAIDPRGHKVAQHYGAPELPGPDAVDRSVTDADEAPLREFIRTHLPAADGPRRDASVCLYTLTPDRHFVIDLHPDYKTVALATGFSGHGFKFAPVVGELLADLVETGEADDRTELFRVTRLLG